MSWQTCLPECRVYRLCKQTTCQSNSAHQVMRPTKCSCPAGKAGSPLHANGVYGRGAGVGRKRGVGADLGVGVGLGVDVGVAVAVAVGVGVSVAVGVEL